MWKSIEVRRLLEGITESSLEITADHSIEVERSSALSNSEYCIVVGMVGKDDKTNRSVSRWGTVTNNVAQQSYTEIVPKDQDLFALIIIYQQLKKLRQLSMHILTHKNI